MTIISTQIVDWRAAGPDPDIPSTDTLMVPPVECAGRDVWVIQEDNSQYAPAEEDLLHGVVDSIQRLAPLDVDRENQHLLDAAIEHQQMDACDDIQEWASRLANDVKDADD